MNWFVLTAGVLYLGGATVYFIQGNVLLGGAFVAYAIANFFLARLG